jgi:hypothetical protein
MNRGERADTSWIDLSQLHRPFLRILLSLGALLVLLGGDFAYGAQLAPALLDNSVRLSDPLTGYVLNNDFTRIFFVKPGTGPVSSIGRTDTTYQGKVVQARTFMSATILYQPNMTAIDGAHFVGADDRNPQTTDLVAMRCRPSDPDQLGAILASWPKLFAAADTDLANLMGYIPSDCDPLPDASDPVDLRVYCMAHGFSDKPNKTVPISLQAAVDTGSAMFQLTGTPFLPTNSKTGADVLYDLYLVGLGYSGLGYAVRDSYLQSQGGNVPLSAGQALTQSVVAEYLVRNVSLLAGSCRCVRVSPYSNRDQSPLNWNSVWNKGRLNPADGSCVQRDRMP